MTALRRRFDLVFPPERDVGGGAVETVGAVEELSPLPHRAYLVSSCNSDRTRYGFLLDILDSPFYFIY